MTGTGEDRRLVWYPDCAQSQALGDWKKEKERKKKGKRGQAQLSQDLSDSIN
jgi:hypothetical protein